MERILFLGRKCELSEFLKRCGFPMSRTEEKIKPEGVSAINPDLILSYNYSHILQKEILDIPTLGSINLHTSYLPYNRGAYPIIWSILDGTPSGVSIHIMDSGIDTGPILYQKRIRIKNCETLQGVYDRFQNEIQRLFITNIDELFDWKLEKMMKMDHGKTQEGTYHSDGDSWNFLHLIEKDGWNTTVGELKRKWRNENPCLRK